MKEVLGSLPEVITAYKNYNLLVPTATDVQLNPFYKFHVEEVPVDLGETSGDIFKVGSVKTGKQDERGKDIWEDVFSLSKPLLNKMAMAAGIQFNPKETYGERIDRGIKVCDEWQEFGTFRDWALENGYSDNLTLDRIDVNGNYEPSNCRWADAVTQMNNRRSTPHYTVDGRSLTISQWSRETGIPRSTILNRLKRGMSFEAAIEKGDYKCQNS